MRRLLSFLWIFCQIDRRSSVSPNNCFRHNASTEIQQIEGIPSRPMNVTFPSYTPVLKKALWIVWYKDSAFCCYENSICHLQWTLANQPTFQWRLWMGWCSSPCFLCLASRPNPSPSRRPPAPRGPRAALRQARQESRHRRPEQTFRCKSLQLKKNKKILFTTVHSLSLQFYVVGLYLRFEPKTF